MATMQASGPALLMIVVIPAAVIAYLLQVGLYAAVFFRMERKLGLGSITSAVDGTALDFF